MRDAISTAMSWSFRIALSAGFAAIVFLFCVLLATVYELADYKLFFAYPWRETLEIVGNVFFRQLKLRFNGAMSISIMFGMAFLVWQSNPYRKRLSINIGVLGCVWLAVWFILYFWLPYPVKIDPYVLYRYHVPNLAVFITAACLIFLGSRRQNKHSFDGVRELEERSSS